MLKGSLAACADMLARVSKHVQKLKSRSQRTAPPSSQAMLLSQLHRAESRDCECSWPMPPHGPRCLQSPSARPHHRQLSTCARIAARISPSLRPTFVSFPLRLDLRLVLLASSPSSSFAQSCDSTISRLQQTSPSSGHGVGKIPTNPMLAAIKRPRQLKKSKRAGVHLPVRIERMSGSSRVLG